jgi:apolipoprotein D and lipocalin family protein
MKKFVPVLLTLLFSLSLHAQVLSTATNVDVARYVGKWYTITSLPQIFTINCKGQTAEYEIINEKTISVVNTCIKSKGVTKIEGKAVVKNPKTNAELIVTFNNFFTRLFRVKGDYTIIKLDPNYEYSLVGSKDRKSLWLLARSPVIPEEVIAEYVAFAKKEGFPVEKLVPSEF